MSRLLFGVRRLASCASLLLMGGPLAAAQDTARVVLVRSLLAEADALDPRAASTWLETSALLEIGALDVLDRQARAGRLSAQELAALARVYRPARPPRAHRGVAVPRVRQRTLTPLASESGTTAPARVTAREGIRRPYCAVNHPAAVAP